MAQRQVVSAGRYDLAASSVRLPLAVGVGVHFREALSHGSTTASEDIKRIEGHQQSRRQALRRPAGRRALRDARVPLGVGRHPCGRQALYAGRPRVGSSRIQRTRGTPKPTKYVVDGISLGARLDFSDYQEYQCTPSQQFEGVTWCNKQRVEEEPSRLASLLIHDRSLTRRDHPLFGINLLEPAFFNAGEVDNEIERLSDKFGEQARRLRPYVRLGPDTDGIIATWGKVALEPLDANQRWQWGGTEKILLRES